MELKEYIIQLAKQQFGDFLAGVDFWGPIEGDDMMGELILSTELDDDEVLEKLHSIHRQTREHVWRVTLGWVANNTGGLP